MRDAKKRRLEAKGWKVGTAREFLGLSDQESVHVELKLRLADSLKKRRRRRACRLLFSELSPSAKLTSFVPI